MGVQWVAYGTTPSACRTLCRELHGGPSAILTASQTPNTHVYP